MIQGLIAPFQYFSNPADRLYWPLLLSTLMASSAFYYFAAHWQQQAMKPLLTRRYWLGKSSQQDFFWIFLNNLLRYTVVLPLLGSQLILTLGVVRGCHQLFGVMPDTHFATWEIMLIFSISIFIIDDLSRYYLHLALHKMPFLWHFHRVHHSAQTLTPFTVHRVHPIEMLLYTLRQYFVFGGITGGFIYLFGAQLSAFEIFGVYGFGFIFNAALSNLRHTPVFMGFGPWENLFISPAQHQIHHSQAQEHRDKNLGACLSLWDRIHGSYIASNTVKTTLKFGV